MRVKNSGGGAQEQSPQLMDAIHRNYLVDEDQLMEQLMAILDSKQEGYNSTQAVAENLICAAREKISGSGGLQALLRHYDLSTQEGVVLMCLAEALLRIPDSATVDALIADKLATGQWQQHLGQSDSMFVNASTWALMLSGRLLKQDESPEHFISKLINRLDAPVLRAAIRQAMKLVAEQFVMGPDIQQALARAGEEENQAYLYSFDMLGEAALTVADAARYQQAYLEAIAVIGEAADLDFPIQQRPGISIKLSALYARYEYKQQAQAVDILVARLLELAQAAMQAGIGLTVDAEEADRLTMSLDIFEQVYLHSSLQQWPGLGLAVQAYQKRALSVLEYLSDLAHRGKRKISVRLVKGAYWDTEIKRAQQQGLRDYPVFTRKENTDVSYLVCAHFLLTGNSRLYPQFATHNAYTVAAILTQTHCCDYEFQRLHGMGDALYQQLVGDIDDGRRVPDQKGSISESGKPACRVYAPVGVHKDLLPYLVRRLLENGANTSFVNQLAHPEQPLKGLATNPYQQVLQRKDGFRHSQIPLPSNMFADIRDNSRGINFADPCELQPLLHELANAYAIGCQSQPIIDGQEIDGAAQVITNPANTEHSVGVSRALSLDQVAEIEGALSIAIEHQSAWSAMFVVQRAQILRTAADLFEQHRAELIALCVKETGKTLTDSHADVREAIDFLRYYAQQAVELMAEAQTLPSITGESNKLSLGGRGVFLCISPWNFPVAIFTGQIAAALVTGNAVLAKPSSLASLTARRVVDLLYQAGVPAGVLHYVPCDAQLLTHSILQDQRLAGVVFTGSFAAARQINQQLAQREGAIATLIAETGGQNALVADSSAQPEQLVKDVISSAFNSAGQRCSALRVLYVQEDIAERVIELLIGAMDQLVIGDPAKLITDVGPVISAQAQQALETHVFGWQQRGALLHQCQLPGSCRNGLFIAPALIEITAIDQLHEEHFGPILHLVRYQRSEFEKILAAINATGYGLTFGFHSRIEHSIRLVEQKIKAGNLYINRDTIGAVVGSQPFGGSGLSGTGPKAGGPNYLLRFTTEQTCTINTTAVGGNALLLSQLK